MSWSMRHEGSPNVTASLTPNQIIEGINEGVWEVTDEVRGPGDTKWVPLEEHPFFAEALADYDPTPRKHEDVEEHLDMNPLIDVALVLLIFFILTTSYDAMKKVIDMPSMTKRNEKGIPVIERSQVQNEFVLVEAKLSPDNAIVFKVDGNEVPEDKLEYAIFNAVASGRSKMIIDVDNVTWGSVVKIIDAGKGARVTRYMMRVK